MQGDDEHDNYFVTREVNNTPPATESMCELKSQGSMHLFATGISLVQPNFLQTKNFAL
jgi:hypothetical protein